jgi:hypothetical protein
MRVGSCVSPCSCHARAGGHPVNAGHREKHDGRGVLDRPIKSGDDAVFWYA